jgi:hypothetical protein
MLRTVVNQSYTSDFATDTSGFFNHGIPIQVAAEHPGFGFGQPGSRITIAPSFSLSNLECIEAAVSLVLAPKGASHRYNLAEGHLSFALYINPDHSIEGTIVDSSGNWKAATSGAAAVSLNTRHSAVLQCDGISMVRVVLDGKIVAANYNVLGAVRSVGPFGVAVGHWPDPPEVYTFQGTIFAFQLRAYDPQKDRLRGISPCCFDRKAVAQWFTAMAKKGITADKLSQAADKLAAAAKAAAIAMRGGQGGATLTQQTLAAAVSSALSRRDFAALQAALNEWQQFANQRLPAADRAKYTSDLQSAIAAFGMGWSDWCSFLKLFCLDPCNLFGKGDRYGR